jgi:hypothetical protein
MTNFTVRNFQPIPATRKEQQLLESYKHDVDDELPEIQGVKWVYKSTNEVNQLRRMTIRHQQPRSLIKDIKKLKLQNFGHIITFVTVQKTSKLKRI